MATLSIAVSAGSVTVTIPDTDMARIVKAAQATRYDPSLTAAQTARQLIEDWVGDLKAMVYAYELAQNAPPAITSTVT